MSSFYTLPHTLVAIGNTRTKAYSSLCTVHTIGPRSYQSLFLFKNKRVCSVLTRILIVQQLIICAVHLSLILSELAITCILGDTHYGYDSVNIM